MKKVNSFQEIQGFLSVGYIYLIVMGILNQTLYYNQIGVDILNYSSILDVLISPISKLTSSYLSLSIFILMILSAFILPKALAKKKDKNWFNKLIKMDKSLTIDQIESTLLKNILLIISIGLLGFFVGSGIGKGKKISEKITEGKIKYNDKISFINGETSNIKIIGTNSSYVFYLTDETKTVRITPIEGIVKSLEDNK